MNKKWLLLVIALSIFLVFSPEIDQYIAALSYTETTKTFYGESAPWCQIIYYSVPVITAALVLAPLIWLFKARRDSQKCKAIIRFGLMTYLALILGPGLVVNVIFKDNWGRPRPYQVLRDGKQYSPFWQPHFTEKENNSFPGGHASIGFFLGIPFLALGRKKTAIILSLIGGTVVGTVRILQGGHYLSDVVFAGIFVWLTAIFIIYILDQVGITGK
ncbi:MAG TPA: phosphatase PAP2 family protein [Aquella sp.]|nr:phosphatase PAP2 family protein [Aquella sp.]